MCQAVLTCARTHSKAESPQSERVFHGSEKPTRADVTEHPLVFRIGFRRRAPSRLLVHRQWSGAQGAWLSAITNESKPPAFVPSNAPPVSPAAMMLAPANS